MLSHVSLFVVFPHFVVPYSGPFPYHTARTMIVTPMGKGACVSLNVYLGGCFVNVRYFYHLHKWGHAAVFHGVPT